MSKSTSTVFALPQGRTATLRPFDAASPHLADAVRVYTDTWRRDWGPSLDFIRRYTNVPGYIGLAAEVTEGGRGTSQPVVAMGFGTRSLPGQWWHDRVAQEVGPRHEALQNAWVLVELAVRDGYRNIGVGEWLLMALLHEAKERISARRALLSVAVSNQRAQRFYLRNGWSMLHPGFVFRIGQPPYAVMRRELGPPGI